MCLTISKASAMSVCFFTVFYNIFQVFATSTKALQVDLKSRPDGDHLVWDKDEKSAMDFVTACANIRAHIFNIQLKSRFEIKCMYH